MSLISFNGDDRLSMCRAVASGEEGNWTGVIQTCAKLLVILGSTSNCAAMLCSRIYLVCQRVRSVLLAVVLQLVSANMLAVRMANIQATSILLWRS